MRIPAAQLLLVGMLSVAFASFGADEKGPVASVKPDSTGFNAQWNAPGKVDDREARTLKSGTGVIRIPVWWGDSLRPKEGQNFIAEIEFKDVVAAPIRVEVFAGLPDRYEVHRIGGLNDSQWKTARVPLPWDMLMRIPGTSETELVLHHPGGTELPVSRIDIVKSDDPVKDEAAWDAETRAWVRRVQAGKKAEAPPAETAVIPDVLKNSRIVPFVRSTAKVIYTTSAPLAGQAGKGVEIRMARNEVEPAQFGIYANGAALKNVRVSLPAEGFKTAKGESLKAPVQLFTAEYAIAIVRKKGRIFPQRLWPAYAVDIAPGASHMFWMTVDGVAKKADAGVYEGRVRIEADGVDASELAVRIEVLPLELLTMKEAGIQMGSCTTGLVPAHEVRFLVHNNQNITNLWYSGVQFPFKKKADGGFDLDFTVADDWMKHAHEAGIENFIYYIGGNPYGFPDTMSLERELYRGVLHTGDDMVERAEFIKKATAAPDTIIPELRPLYEQWVRLVMAHARENNWPEPVLSPFDEPAKWSQGGSRREKFFYYVDKKTNKKQLQRVPLNDVDEFLKKQHEAGNEPQDLGIGGAAEWIKSHFKDSCAAIREADSKARIYASIHHVSSGMIFTQDLDIFGTNAIHEDPHLGDKVRAAHKVFWQYSGGATDSSDPSGPRFNYGFFFAGFNSRGAMCWAYNWGPRFDTSSGKGWVYAWTTPYGVARSPGVEGVREGWDDRRYIETLRAEAKKKGREKEAEALLSDLFEKAISSRSEGGRDTVFDFWANTKDPEALGQMREKVIAMLLQLQAGK